MTFEERFPSLKKYVDIKVLQHYPFRELLREHCLDKAKVKEALAGGSMTNYPNTDREENWIKVDIKKWKELGL